MLGKAKDATFELIDGVFCIMPSVSLSFEKAIALQQNTLGDRLMRKIIEEFILTSTLLKAILQSDL